MFLIGWFSRSYFYIFYTVWVSSNTIYQFCIPILLLFLCPKCHHPGLFLIYLNLWRLYGASLVAQMFKHLPVIWETGFDSWVGKIPWRKEWLPTPVFWPREFHGLYSLWGWKSGTQLSNFYFHTVGPCQLSVLNIAVCMCPSQTP